MTTVTAKELRDNLDSIVRRARAGETIRVTYRNRPAFVIQPESVSQRAPLSGLQAFMASTKRPSPFETTPSLKTLYRDSLTTKYGK